MTSDSWPANDLATAEVTDELAATVDHRGLLERFALDAARARRRAA